MTEIELLQQILDVLTRLDERSARGEAMSEAMMASARVAAADLVSDFNELSNRVARLEGQYGLDERETRSN